jgi:patatin-like phospholipase/acyl hydrolase
MFPAHFLDLFEKQHGSPLSKNFDLLVGTSTGAIIAAAAATHFPMAEVVERYEQYAPQIFRKRLWSLGGIVSSKYDSGPLRELIGGMFSDNTMQAAKQRLLIPTTDVSNGNVFVIKSPYLSTFVRDKNIRLVDAVLASCAAPSFFDPVRVGEYLLADGGLWANNPSFVAYTEAVGKLDIDQDDVRILSIGTGTGHQCYDIGNLPQRWGLATGWQRSRLIDTAMNIQGRASSNTATLLLKNKYRRVSFDETGNLPLDETTCIPRLKSKAGEAFTYQHDSVVSFLGL